MHEHFFLEERDETTISTKGKLPYQVNVQYVRDNVCMAVRSNLMNIAVATCNGCNFSECIVNK